MQRRIVAWQQTSQVSEQIEIVHALTGRYRYVYVFNKMRIENHVLSWIVRKNYTYFRKMINNGVLFCFSYS